MMMISPSEFASRHVAPAKHLPYSGHARDGPDVWDVIREADATMDGAKTRLLYSGYEIPPGERDAEYAAGWTREHVWPRSKGGMTTSRPGAGTDAHNIFAADASVNSSRSNKMFRQLGVAGEAVFDKSPQGGADGRLLARASPHAWEPPDFSKGVVARALLYMACAYSEELGSVDAVGSLADILEWNKRFPPDERERRRNDIVERYQCNRNPFIDDPSLSDKIDWT